MAEYRNELLEGWVGKPVVLSMLKPPDWGEEDEEIEQNIDRMADDPMFARVQMLHSIRGAYELVGYDRLGVTLRQLGPESRAVIFVPWSAVIRIEQGFEEHEDLLG